MRQNNQYMKGCREHLLVSATMFFGLDYGTLSTSFHFSHLNNTFMNIFIEIAVHSSASKVYVTAYLIQFKCYFPFTFALMINIIVDIIWVIELKYLPI